MAGEVVDITIIEENEEVVLNVLTSWVVRAAAIWFQNENPVLRKGQIGIETDTQKMKLGDGVTEWNSLAYLVVTASQISALINAGPRVQTITTASSITANTDLYDEIVVTALASNAAIAAPTGTPSTRKKILYHIRDNGTPWTLTPNAIFRDFTGSFPSTTTAGRWLRFEVEWNLEDSTWDIIDVIPQPNVAVPLGIITRNPFSSGQWTVQGSAIWSFASDGITMVSSAGSLTDRIILTNQYTDLLNEKITVEFVLNNLTGDGIYFGWQAENTYNPKHYQFGFNPTNGTTYLFSNTVVGGWDLVQNSSALALLSGDTIRMVIVIDKNVVSCVTTNTRTGLSASQSYTNDFYSNVAGNFKKLGIPVIYGVGGNAKITKYERSSSTLKNAPFITVGTSITHGYHAGSWEQTYSALLGCEQNAGGSETTIEVLKKLPQIIALAPRKVYLEMLVNDWTLGVAGRITNYISIVDQLEAAGIEVVCLSAVPGFSGSPGGNAWLLSEYPDKYIDITTPLESSSNVLNPSYDAGDNHTNANGNAAIYNAIILSGK